MTGSVTVLYRDEHILVVDKPAGIAVHRGWAAEPDTVAARVRALVGGTVHAAHRLDRGTSGVLLFGLSPAVAATLARSFAEGEVEKRYLALVRGRPPEAGDIDHPVPTGEEPDAPRAPARTSFVRLEVFGRYSLVEAVPHTGRLHQIRRHLKHISCPLIGDVTYGKGAHNRYFRERFGLDRLFLHAASLQVRHPVTGALFQASAPLPPELERTLAMLRADPSPGEGIP